MKRLTIDIHYSGYSPVSWRSRVVPELSPDYNGLFCLARLTSGLLVSKKAAAGPSMSIPSHTISLDTVTETKVLPCYGTIAKGVLQETRSLSSTKNGLLVRGTTIDKRRALGPYDTAARDPRDKIHKDVYLEVLRTYILLDR